MERKLVSGIMLSLLLTSMLTLAFNIQPVRASETIYIRPDGTVEGTDKIQRDGDIYTFTDNIYGEIVVEKDNVEVDGASYTLQGTGSGYGFYLNGISNVTIKNIEIKAFDISIYLTTSSNIIIAGNTITDNYDDGILVGWGSSNNIISGNTITDNGWCGIGLRGYNNSVSGNTITDNYLDGILLLGSNNTIFGNKIIANGRFGITLAEGCSGNSISGNNITNNNYGVFLRGCSGNSISGSNIANNNYGIHVIICSDNAICGNNITNNDRGIELYSSSNNIIYHNNFVDNTEQVYSEGSTNVWDDGYPSGGNYWSDYTTRYPDAQELDDSGIWDSPYVIDGNNQDNYPLMETWTPSPPLPRTIDELKTEIEKCWSEGEIDNQGIVRSFIAKLNVAQKLVDKGKIDEAKSILEDDFIPQVQNLSGIHITPEAADILVKSAEYIVSHL